MWAHVAGYVTSRIFRIISVIVSIPGWVGVWGSHVPGPMRVPCPGSDACPMSRACPGSDACPMSRACPGSDACPESRACPMRRVCTVTRASHPPQGDCVTLGTDLRGGIESEGYCGRGIPRPCTPKWPTQCYTWLNLHHDVTRTIHFIATKNRGTP